MIFASPLSDFHDLRIIMFPFSMFLHNHLPMFPDFRIIISPFSQFSLPSFSIFMFFASSSHSTYHFRLSIASAFPYHLLLPNYPFRLPLASPNRPSHPGTQIPHALYLKNYSLNITGCLSQPFRNASVTAANTGLVRSCGWKPEGTGIRDRRSRAFLGVNLGC
jgi:hypothetical protein